MNVISKIAVTTALVASLTGCIVVGGVSTDSSDWRQEQHANAEYISALKLGVSADQVIEDLGVPASSEAFMHKSGELRVLYYRTKHAHSDGKTTADETTPLVFVDNRLVGWGESAYERIIQN